VTSKEFLDASHLERADTIRKLGFRRPAVIEDSIQWSIMQCMDDIAEACRDLPMAERYDGSNNSREVLDPSQSFPGLRNELQRLYKYFLKAQQGGRGRPPKMPKSVGHDALCALLGEAPFGDELIVAAKMDFEPIKRSKTKVRVKTITIVRWEFYSRKPSIRREQCKRFSKLRTADGCPLVVSTRSLAKNAWPASFLKFMQEARRRNPQSSLPLEEFIEAIGDERAGAIANIGRVLSMIEHFLEIIDSGSLIREPDETRSRAAARAQRGSRTKKANTRASEANKRKGKTTVTDWSSSDPGFALASSIIHCVAPISRGVPSFNTRGQRRANGRSQRELIAELIRNAVKLVQKHIDSSPVFEGPEYKSVCRKNTFLGPGRSTTRRVDALVALILALRTQLLAYWIARSTIFAICAAAYTHARDEDVIAAAHCVSATIITSLDTLIDDRRQHLRFGTDRVRSEVGKWFGFFTPDTKRGLSREQRIVRAVLPRLGPSRTRHLTLYSELIQALNVGDDALAAWMRLAEWAKDGNGTWWRVCVPDSDQFNEVFDPSHPDQRVS
jgi:hypothetical protein